MISVHLDVSTAGVHVTLPVVRLHCVCFRALSQCGGLPVLEHLNLSGCLFITEVGLQELVSACPSLNDEHFYYCDNINGNTSETVGIPFSYKTNICTLMSQNRALEMGCILLKVQFARYHFSLKMNTINR